MDPLRLAAAVILLSAAARAAGEAPPPADPFLKVSEDASGTRYRLPAFRAFIDVPAGFTRTAPRRNGDIAYDFALRAERALFEVRLKFDATREDPARAKERAACAAKNRRKPGSCFMADLEAPSDAWGRTIAANMNDGSPVDFTPFPADGVRKEFGADWGFASAPILLDQDRSFNQGGFTLGQVVVLHRRGVGTLTRIVLADSAKSLVTLDRDLFYHARFEGAEPPGR